MVKALYMKDPKNKHTSVITKMGMSEINRKKYNWIQLNETIFHPKGGGQPSDEGTINGIQTAYIHKEVFDKTDLNQFEIYHCFEANQPFNVGDRVDLLINSSIRSLHSRLHTAGHLLADAVSKCFPELKAYQGNHYPRESYVKFKIEGSLSFANKEEFKEKAQKQFNFWIDQGIIVEDILVPSGTRVVKVVENWTPCGGTHIKNLKEIGPMVIADLSHNNKENILTVKYCLK